MELGKATVFRYNPETDMGPRYETYQFPFQQGMTVLDVAMYIYENLDPTFSFSYCCRNSHCGLCGAKINGQPGLMCRESATVELTLAPLDNLTVVRDLVVDRLEYEQRKESLRLFLDRTGSPEQLPEKVEKEDLQRFKVTSRCVECYACISTCPVLKKNHHGYLGPAGLVLLARHTFDPRDELNREVLARSGGVENCNQCKLCNKVCPHEISPADNIKLLGEQSKKTV